MSSQIQKRKGAANDRQTAGRDATEEASRSAEADRFGEVFLRLKGTVNPDVDLGF